MKNKLNVESVVELLINLYAEQNGVEATIKKSTTEKQWTNQKNYM